MLFDLSPAVPLNFMLHDFGARGVSSNESSMLAGMAHIVNFLGTDTVMGLVGALAHYSKEFDTFLAKTPDNPTRAMVEMLDWMEANNIPVPAYSVEASEHSTMTIKGKEGEFDQIKALIEKAKEGRIVSIVSDSYNYFHNVMDVYGDALKKDILEAGKAGGRVVIRPDSGDAVEVITRTLDILAQKFADECTINSKGKLVLPNCLRVLQGDGIDLDSLHNILKAVENRPIKIKKNGVEVEASGYSVENLVFGMGGGLEQKVTRDDLNFAQKASAARIKGVWHDVFKDPVTADPQFVKKSKKGRLSTVWDGVAFATKRTVELLTGEKDRMEVVYKNGKIMKHQTFDDIRRRAEYFTHMLLHPSSTPIPDPWEAAKKPATAPTPGA
jgi:nicotinamide phosphoribosyltransferase